MSNRQIKNRTSGRSEQKTKSDTHFRIIFFFKSAPLWNVTDHFSISLERIGARKDLQKVSPNIFFFLPKTLEQVASGRRGASGGGCKNVEELMGSLTTDTGNL